MDDLDMQRFGQRLGEARRAKGLTRVALATLAGVKSAPMLTSLESGQRDGIRGETLYRLCQVLQVSADYLLGLTDDPRPRPSRKRPPSS